MKNAAALFTLYVLVFLLATACVKEDYFGKSTLKELLHFHIPGQVGKAKIDHDSLMVAIDIPSGTNLTALAPDSIRVSTFAVIEPGEGQPQNFSTAATYKVTREDKSSVAYQVVVK